MGLITGIAWTDHTHNEWIGCQKISQACENCYAEVSPPVRGHRAKGLELWGPPKTTARQLTGQKNRNQPLRWDKAARAAGVPARTFCASLADVFEDHPSLPPWRENLWKTVERTQALDWQLLTKRPGNIRSMVPAAWLGTPPKNVWYGTTVEDQRRARERIPALLAVPAVVRFLSVEPMLEAIDLRPYLYPEGTAGTCVDINGDWWHEPGSCPNCRPAISWVIVGGESGTKARPFNIAWARDIIAQCREAQVPVFMKQLGSNPIMEPGPITWPTMDSHGADPNEWPEDIRVREFPPVRRLTQD